MGALPKPSVSGFGGERRCDGVSETCPAFQGQGERYTVRTDEAEGLTPLIRISEKGRPFFEIN